MILEIHYKGEVIMSLPVPEVANIDELSFSARFASSMDETKGEVDHWRRPKIHRVDKTVHRVVPHNKKYFDTKPAYHFRHPDFQKMYVKKKKKVG